MTDQSRHFGAVIDRIMPFTASNEPSTEHILADAYKKHNDHIRAICPKDRLLEFNYSMGFKELCEFLDELVLDQPYPNVNG